MACYQPGTLIDLHNREAVSLDDVRGATLRLIRGTLWVTQHHDTEDIVLRSGDNWVVERDGRTVLEAQEDTVVCIVGRAIKPLAQPWKATSSANWYERLAERLANPNRFVPHY
jgi:hypothetical protein